MFRFFGGVPRLVVPDNLKSGVHRASFYDPEINRSYGMMASHYGIGILPARPRKPRDKAKVEAGVRFAQTYILGRLRRQTFFSLAEANAAITAALERINAHVMRRIGVSRRQLFETVEMPVLSPLPDADYQFAEWLLARVSLHYHVEIDGFFYSIPHGLIREQVDFRATTRSIELFHRVCVLLLTSAVMAAAGTALIPITCPVRIGVTPSGLPIDSGAGVGRSACRCIRPPAHAANRPSARAGAAAARGRGAPAITASKTSPRARRRPRSCG